VESEKPTLEDIQTKYNVTNPDFDATSQQQVPHSTSSLKIGGILLILVGISIIIHWIYFLVTPDFLNAIMSTGVYNNTNITRQDITTVYNFCGTLAIGLSLFTILGGILAIRKQMFWLSLIGGILGIFAIAPLFLFIPNIISLIGVILVLRARKDFLLPPKISERNSYNGIR
jgi:hypothetical protein